VAAEKFCVCQKLRHVIISIGAGSYAGCLAFDRVLDEGRNSVASGLISIAATVQMDDASIYVSSGTTGCRKEHASHQQPDQQRLFRGRKPTGIEPGFARVHQSPRYHCFGMVMGNLVCDPCGNDGLSVGVLRSLKTLETVSKQNVATCSTGTHHVHCPANHPEFARLDLNSLRRRNHAGLRARLSHEESPRQCT